MKTTSECLRLPTGKQIVREFDADQNMVSEMHSYGKDGLLDIAISFSFDHGRKTSEMYLHNRRLVSRKTYERQRSKYPDMPPPGSSMEDATAALLKLAAREKREHSKAAKAHMPDTAKARELDHFCKELIGAGRCENAAQWVQSKGHTLGEMTPIASRRLVDKLVKLGAVVIHACKIDSYEHGRENTGHVVVELPSAAPARTALLKEIDRLARRQGYEGDLDNGQKYAYVKLD